MYAHTDVLVTLINSYGIARCSERLPLTEVSPLMQQHALNGSHHYTYIPTENFYIYIAMLQPQSHCIAI